MLYFQREQLSCQIHPSATTASTAEVLYLPSTEMIQFKQQVFYVDRTYEAE